MSGEPAFRNCSMRVIPGVLPQARQVMYTPSLWDTSSYSTVRDCHCSCETVRGAQECRAGKRCDLAGSYIHQVQHQQVENDEHESWICEVPVCTRYSLDAQNLCGAIDAWNSRDYYQAVESLGRK